MIIEAPNDFPHDRSNSVFLAGSIEMGVAEDWQSRMSHAFADHVLILNPRRRDWDSSWQQSVADWRFTQQVQWELDAMEAATVIAMHFEPDTKSPITLLELGLFARTGKLIVHCPDGFWRKGNVDIVCQRYRVETAATIDELIGVVAERLG